MGIKTNEEFERLMSETAWRFHEKYKDCGGGYEAFRRILKDPSILDECNITEDQKRILYDAIKHRLEPRRAKARADVEVTCYAEEGIEAVKAALLDGVEFSNKTEIPVKINLIAPPVYMVHTMVMDRKEGLSVMNDVVATIKSSILKRGGQFVLKNPPKILNDIDEEELNRQMEKLERANELIDGDDNDTSQSDEEGIDDEESCIGDLNLKAIDAEESCIGGVTSVLDI
ncbi:Eukaryotic translation initiation factor 2 subunit 1 [Thelohanellus kitauei]|uniref:Eukaryotic translation initiation factor 2 subunit 1 n=1 Tax=Thelohanellus kitauei TaxID=669202 RepID=A0A0C2N432_THEKT|nr:Eukaryotic translation initiation factor 2 subunit 1 [Thelohanellus kitauei]